jgi:hypothetical protein
MLIYMNFQKFLARGKSLQQSAVKIRAKQLTICSICRREDSEQIRIDGFD